MQVELWNYASSISLPFVWLQAGCKLPTDCEHIEEGHQSVYVIYTHQQNWHCSATQVTQILTYALIWESKKWFSNSVLHNTKMHLYPCHPQFPLVRFFKGYVIACLVIGKHPHLFWLKYFSISCICIGSKWKLQEEIQGVNLTLTVTLQYLIDNESFHKVTVVHNFNKGTEIHPQQSSQMQLWSRLNFFVLRWVFECLVYHSRLQPIGDSRGQCNY